MKFGKKLEKERITEWALKYVDYKLLKRQIKRCMFRVESLAVHTQSSHNVNAPQKIDITTLPEEIAFLKQIDIERQKVEEFYKTQVAHMIEEFHTLVIELVREGKITEYVPRKRGMQSRLDRHLQRLRATDVEIVGVERTEDLQEEQTKDENGPFPLKIVRKQRRSEVLEVEIKTEDCVEISLDKSSKPTTTTVASPIEVIYIAPDSKAKLATQEVRDAFAEFYRGLILLHHFCEMNFTAFQKIMKKHDKSLGLVMKAEFMKTNIEPMEFAQQKVLLLLLKETEMVYAEAFLEGHRAAAMEELRVPEEKPPVMSHFRLGFFLGMSLVLAFFILYWISLDSKRFPRFDSIVIIYRMLMMTVIMVWAWGLNMFVFTKYGINYQFIFEFDPRTDNRYYHMFEVAAIFSFVWSGSFFLYLACYLHAPGFVWLHEIPWQIHPIAYIAASLVALTVFLVRSKFWLFRTLARIVAAPFIDVRFRDFFLGDQLVSLVIVLQDMEYTLCFFLYDAWTGTDYCMDINIYVKPIIAVLPSLFRFIQCIRRYQTEGQDRRQLWNAGKYSVGILVTIFSALRGSYDSFLAPWLIFVVISTFYTYIWDVLFDWNLHPLYLRKSLLYPKQLYYFAISSNFAARWLWTLTVSPESLRIFLNPLIFATILAAIEILRRAQWNLFRLENEQINNVGKFRAVKEIPIPLEKIKLYKRSKVFYQGVKLQEIPDMTRSKEE